MSVKQYRSNQEISVELLPGNRAAGSLLKQTLALQVWHNVLVTQEITTGLSVFERFTLECLLRLGTCSSADISEVIGAESTLANWWLDGMEVSGLARKIDTSTFAPNIELCTEALVSGSIHKQVESEKTMVWLPQTSEILVLPPHDSIIKTLSTIDPTTSFPLPDSIVGKTRADTIRHSMDHSLLYMSDAFPIISVNDSKIIKSSTCPAYQIELNLAETNSHFTAIDIYGYPVRKGKKNQKKPALIRKHINIPTLKQYIKISRERITSLEHELFQSIEESGLSNPKIVNGSCEAGLSYENAKKIAQYELLDHEKRISFDIYREAVYETRLVLNPSDDKARSLFNLDSAVKTFLVNQHSIERLLDTCKTFNIIEKELLQRLWQLKQYTPIYELREEQDFRK